MQFTYKNRSIHLGHHIISLQLIYIFPTVFSWGNCFLMNLYNFAGSIWASNDVLAKFQFVSDLCIGLAYFVVPLELWYLARKLSLPQYSKIFFLFEALIFLCGATHFINLWVLSCHSETVEIVQTVTKVLCAIASCATAVTLVSIISGLLMENLLYLESKAPELDPEKSLVKIQEGIWKTEC